MSSENLLLMENEKIEIGKYLMECYRVNTLIIGSGAASLNAAISLHSMQQEDIIIVTSEWGGGTSNNTGSDKQTYYKLSLSGKMSDSVHKMARDLFRGRCMHGDIALCEAQGSVRAFMNLVLLGVPFPHDKFGSYTGYKTDNDPHSRATSAGPYTSKMMYTVLGREVMKRGIRVLNRHQVVSLLTDQDKSCVYGALAINLEEKDPLKSLVLFNAVNVVMGTGGPGGIYEASVYPESQTGSTGMAFKAGATGQNLTESQFGIASLKIRWNLSGSYQQVIPRYFSTGYDGKDEQEFLNCEFKDYTSLTKAIFLKGYEWPFDPGKINNWGSSLIDLLVFRETNERKRRVWIDYRRNPSWAGNGSFKPEMLHREVYNYLSRSDAIRQTPVERLAAMNRPALDLFRDKGIDLAKEPVEIAVCAQHNNGGLKGNIWWESDLKHLFPVGEVNGSHGVSRPGGSALNAGQVGSLRAAEYISRKYNYTPPENNDFISIVGESLDSELELASKWLSAGSSKDTVKNYLREIKSRMSSAAGIIRQRDKLRSAAAEAHELLKKIPEVTGAGTVKELADCFLLLDHSLAHYLYLSAIMKYIMEGGRSRGSYLVVNEGFPGISSGSLKNLELCNYDRRVEKNIIEVVCRNFIPEFKIVPVRKIPKQDLWFEKVWKDYLEDKFTDS